MKTKKRKPAKAVTLLSQIEKLLADVLDEFSVLERSVEKNVRKLLLSAEASISEAKDFIAVSVGAAPKRRPRAKAKRVVRAKRPAAA